MHSRHMLLLATLLLASCARQGVRDRPDLPPARETSVPDVQSPPGTPDSRTETNAPDISIPDLPTNPADTPAPVQDLTVPDNVLADLPVADVGHADQGQTSSCQCGPPDSSCPVGSTYLTLESDIHPDLPVALYYPSCHPGPDAPAAIGHRPLLIFGHGYQQSYGDYQYLWEELVPLGIIVALPDRLATAAQIDIDSYADDFLRIHNALATFNLDPQSPFYRRLSGKYVVAGHSTGAGAAFIAASNLRPDFKPATIVAFAPLGTLDKKPMTGPHPKDAAKTVHCPTLILEATEDCILPNNLNSQPLFNALPTETPSWLVTLSNADHCGFTYSQGPGLWLCEAAEGGLCWDFPNNRSTQGPTMGSALQNPLALTITLPWLAHHLLSTPDAWAAFQQALTQPDMTHVP